MTETHDRWLLGESGGYDVKISEDEYRAFPRYGSGNGLMGKWVFESELICECCCWVKERRYKMGEEE